MDFYYRTNSRNRTVRRRNFGMRTQIALAGIQRRIREIQEKRGQTNENLVAEILDGFKKQRIICHFYSTQHYDKKDRAGVDFVVIKSDSSRIGIQVKSSLWNVVKFKEKRTLIDGKNIWNIWCHVALVKTDYLINNEPLKKELLEIVVLDKDGRTI